MHRGHGTVSSVDNSGGKDNQRYAHAMPTHDGLELPSDSALHWRALWLTVTRYGWPQHSMAGRNTVWLTSTQCG